MKRRSGKRSMRDLSPEQRRRVEEAARQMGVSPAHFLQKYGAGGDSELPAADAEAIDKRSEELQDEFFAHVREAEARHKEPVDRRLVFEGWSIQKLAGIQVALEYLGERLQPKDEN